MNVEQPSVVIISDDAEFARTIMAGWQTARDVPAFTQMRSDLGVGAAGAAFDLAIVGPVANGALAAVLDNLDSPERPTIYVGSNAELQSVRDAHPRVLALCRQEGWTEPLLLLATEALRRAEAQARARRAEQAAAASQRNAALGRYMLEMRHGFNNAMTSLLGNAELLLLESRDLSPQVRDQLETIHSMAMRMHEIMQRFSSLEAEMAFAEKRSQYEASPSPQALSQRV